jgi:DNA polymerase III delta prime subunit
METQLNLPWTEKYRPNIDDIIGHQTKIAALKSLINHCFDIKINRPDKREIMKRMWFIMNEENMNIDLQIVEKMVESSGNDLRNVINNLQFSNFNKWFNSHG